MTDETATERFANVAHAAIRAYDTLEGEALDNRFWEMLEADLGEGWIESRTIGDRRVAGVAAPWSMWALKAAPDELFTAAILEIHDAVGECDYGPESTTSTSRRSAWTCACAAVCADCNLTHFPTFHGPACAVCNDTIAAAYSSPNDDSANGLRFCERCTEQGEALEAGGDRG